MWVVFNTTVDEIPNGMQQDYNARPMAWQEGGKLLTGPGGAEIDPSLLERFRNEEGEMPIAPVPNPPMWKEWGFESQFGPWAEIADPTANGGGPVAALTKIGEIVNPKTSTFSDLMAFGGDLAKFFGPTIGLGTLMGGGLGALGGAGGGGSPWTSGYDLAGGGAFGGVGGVGGAGAGLADVPWTSGFDLAGGGDAVAATGGVTGVNAPLPTVDPSSVMGVDYGTAGEGTGLLQGAATGAGGPTTLQMDALTKLSKVPGGTSMLERLLKGEASTADYTSLLGTLGATVLGALGSEKQADALSNTADKYLALGAPYRSLLAGSYGPGFSMSDEPGYKDALDQTMQSYLRKASTGGNPFENAGVSQEILKGVNASLALPQLNTYRSQLGSFGQLGTNIAGTADMGAAGQAGGLYDALGYGLNALTQPKNNTLQTLLEKFIATNGSSFT